MTPYPVSTAPSPFHRLLAKLRTALRKHWIGLLVFAMALTLGIVISTLWLHAHHVQPATTATQAAVAPDPTHPPLPAPMPGGLSTLPAQMPAGANAAYIEANPGALPESTEASSDAMTSTAQNPDLPTSRTAAGDNEAQVIERMPPEYPVEALRAHEEGEVRLEVALDALGNVEDVRIASTSHSQNLDRAAMDAVRNWHFRPATHDGQPIGGMIEVPVDFRLDEQR